MRFTEVVALADLTPMMHPQVVAISIFKAIFRFIAFALSFRVISDGTHHTLGIFAGVCYLNSGEVGAHSIRTISQHAL